MRDVWLCRQGKHEGPSFTPRVYAHLLRAAEDSVRQALDRADADGLVAAQAGTMTQ